MSSTGATTPAWEQKLRDDMALSVSSLDMTSAHSQDAVETTSFTVAMHNDDHPTLDSVVSQLTSINVASVYHIQTATGTYIETIRGLKNTQPDREIWYTAIRNARETAIKSISDRRDKAADEAVQLIESLPPAQQSRAANFMSHSLGIVNQASSGLSSIDMCSVKDFLAENWNKLTEVDNDVKAACNYAINALNAVF
ncbi:hypothetical protein H9Q72_011006 [Fusarium xylarioides]|uniref:Uncharacterized protein n=1 Tax=Fusarium xylarioides TaxID=221167 RepID=A0A9P7HHJ1_9HYPO|nr:hypothetical protein H9Q70_008320 [Fusarium xylarioides]KAG5760881.1 hypothetical protein H9Q72_011006 [Fusarium xylarioides]KAG5777500.1 hypothetical protein H9Q73_008824 [Fusarium xylarioides]